MILSYEHFAQAKNETERIIELCSKEEIKNELVVSLKNIPQQEQSNYLDHLSSLFLNVLLNRVDELGIEAKEKAIEARSAIAELKNHL